MQLNPMFKKINSLRNGKKGVVTSVQDLTQLTFLLVKRKLVKSLDGGHIFNTSIGKAESGRYLSLKPTSSKGKIQGQPNLGSKE